MNVCADTIDCMCKCGTVVDCADIALLVVHVDMELAGCANIALLVVVYVDTVVADCGYSIVGGCTCVLLLAVQT